ncbi:MAG TPA: protoporphyrinogen oxidase, partial [Chlamydiales bacterium]|nr:protoporphyrinogen oxidase [Chlamydiales bacterium]
MKIAILGGGISGLSAAWFLRKKYPDAKMILFEKEKRLGGLIGSYKEGDFFFEKGPRIFPVARSPHLIQLICEVGLKEEMIFAPPHATKRYLWTNGAFRPLSSFALRILFSLVKEPFQPKGESEDESIASFGRRRFGRFLTETLIDPMALGIYGGDIEKLSIRSCFPSLFSLEKKKGRLFPHLLFQKKGERQFFTLRRGMHSLIERLGQRSNIELHVGEEVESIEKTGVVAKGTFYAVDRIFSALPLQTIGKLTGLWTDAEAQDLVVAHLAYRGVKLPKAGIGYLVPSKEKEKLLGMICE